MEQRNSGTQIYPAAAAARPNVVTRLLEIPKLELVPPLSDFGARELEYTPSSASSSQIPCSDVVIHSPTRAPPVTEIWVLPPMTQSQDIVFSRRTQLLSLWHTQSYLYSCPHPYSRVVLHHLAHPRAATKDATCLILHPGRPSARKIYYFHLFRASPPSPQNKVSPFFIYFAAAAVLEEL